VSTKKRSPLRDFIEFLPAWLLLKTLGLLPRSAARLIGRALARTSYLVAGNLRRTGARNLKIALPDLSESARRRVLVGLFDSLGNLLGEFSQFPKHTRSTIERVVRYEGLENYLNAAGEGRGVLLLTGHFGSWELCAFAQGLYGHPLSFLVRPLDNGLLDRLINTYREASGNSVIDKNRAVRPVMEALKHRGDVGMLIDANTLREEGVFCDFFGFPASSTTGLAVFALRTGAPVVPGFLIWDREAKTHKLIFEPEVPLIRTGDFKEDVQTNTARFTKVIEQYARRYPEQWLWIHKRWNTRPEGETGLYDQQEIDLRLDTPKRNVQA